MKDEMRFPFRKSPRLKNFDYTSPNYYFVTICTFQKKCIFGKPGYLNGHGKTALRGLELINSHYPGIYVDKAVVMPNHVHAILVLQNDQHPLTNAVGSYKAYVTKSLRQLDPDIQVWQASFYDHIIRSKEDYQRIWEYIDNNPQKWENDDFYMQIPAD